MTTATNWDLSPNERMAVEMAVARAVARAVAKMARHPATTVARKATRLKNAERK